MQRKEEVEIKQRKTDKAEEREGKKEKKKSSKDQKAIANGKEHNEGLGTMTFSYKNLQIPKDLIKKTKKLVETTTGLNNTFIQFIQQATDDQADTSIRYRHLKAFKAVLSDLRKAHNALEEALKPEFRNMELQNGTEGQHARKTGNVVEPAENEMDCSADLLPDEDGERYNEVKPICDTEEIKETKQPPDENDLVCKSGKTKKVSKDQDSIADLVCKTEMGETVEEPPNEIEVSTKESLKKPSIETDPVDEAESMDEGVKELDNQQDMKSEDKVSNKPEMEEHQTETSVPKKIIKSEIFDSEPVSTAETSLDHDIMSVPPSVPEELFQMVESLADSSMLSQTDTSSVKEVDTKSNEHPPETQCPQPRVKNLIVKLTPVPVIKSSSSRSSRSKDKEKDAEQPSKSKEKDEGKKDSDSSRAEEADSPPRTRRSSRVKTTPLRKQGENKGKKDSSESESEGDGKAKPSKKSSNTKKETKSSEKTSEDSDSDEVPLALLEKAATGNSSTDEEQESTMAKKRLFKSDVSSKDTEKLTKRKRKSESSGSDAESKDKKTSKKKKQAGSDNSDSDSDGESKNKKTSKKKKQAGSDNSDSDSDVESKSKAVTARRRSSRVKKQENSKGNEKDFSDKKQKRSYEKKRKGKSPKAASKLQSSSEEEEEEEAGGDSGEDSDQQKIKPIVEDNVLGGSGVFNQSSGKVVQCRNVYIWFLLLCKDEAFPYRCFHSFFQSHRASPVYT